MKKLFFAVAFALTAESVSADVDSDDIARYFDDPRKYSDVLREYQAMVELEVRSFVVCARSGAFREAMEIRETGLQLQQKREALRPLLREYETSHRDTFQVFKLNTVEIVEAAYKAHRECTEHAANLKIIETKH